MMESTEPTPIDELEVTPAPPTAPIIVLCPICSEQVTIYAYMTTQIMGFDGSEVIISGSLNGTAKHACAKIVT